MKVLVIVGICVSVLQVEALCRFGNEERECAEKLGMSEDDMHSIYETPNPLRAEYTDCVWKKLGFQNDNGDINYQELAKSSDTLLVIARVCPDQAFADAPQYHPNLLSAAVGTCEDSQPLQEPSTDQTAEDVRRCIEYHIQMLTFVITK